MGGLSDWSTLRGYIGLRASEEARLGKFWPEEYESQNRNPSTWVPLEEFGGEADFAAAEARADAYRKRATPIKELRRMFFNRLKEAKRTKRFLNKALFREARDMDDVYLLASLAAEFDAATPEWMKDPAKCAYAGLTVMTDLWSFVSAWFDRAEVKIRKLMAQPRYVLNCWVDDNRDTIVRHDGAEGFLRAFRPQDQLKIMEAAYARLH